MGFFFFLFVCLYGFAGLIMWFLDSRLIKLWSFSHISITQLRFWCLFIKFPYFHFGGCEIYYPFLQMVLISHFFIELIGSIRKPFF